MKYCLVGEKLGHSYSKLIHEKRGYDYTLNEISRQNITNFFKSNDYAGFNITIPYKKEIISHLYYISETAKLIGAVNVVKNEGGKLYGYNTDVSGMKYMISRKGISLKDKVVMILGTGGTSNTCRALCTLEGAKKIIIVGRSSQVNYQNCYDYQETQIIFNTTPVGMSPNCDACPINLEKFSNLVAVFDCIYNPLNTNLILNAKKLNLVADTGLSMLVKQALVAEDIWSNTSHSDSEVEQIIKELKLKTCNIVFMGMPSCGKSTLGEIIAKKLSMPFIDTDVEIERLYSKTPKRIIEESGEQVFRDIESEIIKNLTSSVGQVISIGGGAILKEENRINLKRNGIIIYVKRNLELLSSENRPLSAKKGIQNLYNERKEIYESLADYTIQNNGEIQNTIREIEKIL